jgi:hypothetical protein
MKIFKFKVYTKYWFDYFVEVPLIVGNDQMD